MEQLLNDALALGDGTATKIIGMLSALFMTIMTVVKVVKWAATTAETQISDLANLILMELNRPIEKIQVKESAVKEILTPEGVKVQKVYGINPFQSTVECFLKDENVTRRLSRKERKLIRSRFLTAVAQKLASVEEEKQREFASKVTASLNNSVKAAKCS